MKVLITGDWHLRKDKPRCRKDSDWIGVQRDTLYFIKKIFIEHSCDLLFITGDIFHTAKPPYEIVNLVLEVFSNMKDKIEMIPGNHDLPFHNEDLIEESAYGSLRYSFGKEEKKKKSYIGIHELIIPNGMNIPNFKSTTPDEIFERYSEQYIFSGDWHKNFVERKDGRLLINPGCIIRQSVDMKNYIPCIYTVELEESLTLARILLIDNNPDMIIEDYIIDEKNKHRNIQSFIELIRDKKNREGLDFKRAVMKKIDGLNDPELRKITEQIFEEVV